MTGITRRSLLGQAGAAAAVVVAGGPAEAAARRVFRGGHFNEGVASGDPTPTGITVMTRVHGVEGAGAVRLEVARDPGFNRVILRTTLVTNASLGHSVKGRLSHLLPHRRYWYRFSTRSADSAVGQFRTALPHDSREAVRFAVFSCQEHTFGYFNAHARIADEDVDFVVNLGNYIYADQWYPGAGAARPRTLEPALTLDDFRARYRLYRSDPHLREMQSSHALLSCWDDHEVAGLYAGAGQHGSAYAMAPTRAAHRAWFESMPHYPKTLGTAQTYHRSRFGRTADVFILDTRQYRNSQPCGSDGDPACPRLTDPRTLLSAKQLAYAINRLRSSKARWQLIATPSPVTDFKDAPDHFAGFDSWQGYRVERDKLLDAAAGASGAVFLSGNVRRFIAADVADAQGKAVAPEFVCGSVSAPTDAEVAALAGEPGFGTPQKPTEPAEVTARLKAANPGFVSHDQLHHGYAVCVASRDGLNVRFRKMQTVHARSRALAEGERFSLGRGQRTVRG